jgi:hypothetical protein
MGDVIFVAVTLVFFGSCVAYVRGCGRIVGPDEIADEGTTATASEQAAS